jgi:hypothetical protein
MFYRLLLIGLLLLQAGCVGISLVTGTKQVELSKNIGQHIGDYGNNLSGITTAAVLAQWGPPDTKAVTESGELWTYKSDYSTLLKSSGDKKTGQPDLWGSYTPKPVLPREATPHRQNYDRFTASASGAQSGAPEVCESVYYRANKES